MDKMLILEALSDHLQSIGIEAEYQPVGPLKNLPTDPCIFVAGVKIYISGETMILVGVDLGHQRILLSEPTSLDRCVAALVDLGGRKLRPDCPTA